MMVHTKPSRSVSLILAVMTLAAGVLAEEPVEAPEQPAEADLAQRMGPFVDAIANARTLATAAKAYARGNAIEDRYIPLHQAYMERMLTFGFPDIAAHPARVLVRLEPDNGTAWGVLGYMHGQRDELAEAMVASIRAAKLKPDDPSIMNNAGQLLAWYREVLALPALPDRDKRAIDQMEDRWTQDRMFTRAYDRIRVAFQEQRKLDEVTAEKLATAEAAVLKLQRQAMDIDAELRQVRQDLASHKRLLSWYRLEYRRGAAPYYVVVGDDDDDDVPLWYVPGAHSRWRRHELQTLIVQEHGIIDELQAQANTLYRQGLEVVSLLEEKRESLEQVQDRTRVIRQRLLKRFRWDPPAVNGVVTDERDHLPRAAARNVPAVPVDAETQAAQKLSLAEAYLLSGFDKEARDILQDVVANWPETPAGLRARQLLAGRAR